VWIDRTEQRPDVLIGKVRHDVQEFAAGLAVKGIL
jgi:hypothetical protein